MADTKISALTAATTPLAGTEVLPIVQSGTTKKVAVSDLTAGRAVSTGVLTVSNGTNPYIAMPDGTGTTYIQVASGNLDFVPRSGKNASVTGGNLAFNTAAKGVNFTANTPAAGMTSQLLNWYEEGTWTGTLTAATPPTTPPTATGYYTRVGRQVTVNITFSNVDTSGASGQMIVSGLPFAQGTGVNIGSAVQSGLGATAFVAEISGSVMVFTTIAGFNSVAITAGTGKYLRASVTYFV